MPGQPLLDHTGQMLLGLKDLNLHRFAQLFRLLPSRVTKQPSKRPMMLQMTSSVWDMGEFICPSLLSRQRDQPDTDNQLQTVQWSSAWCRRPLRKKPPDQIIIIFYLCPRTCCRTIRFPFFLTSGKSETKPKISRPTSEVTPMQAIRRAALSPFS